MKNDRLNCSCWLIGVGCWRNTKGLPSSFLSTLAFVIALTFLLAPPLLAQWEPDVRLTYDDSVSWTSGNNAWCIATSGNTVHVVWMDRRNSYLNLEIYYKRSTDRGRHWGADTRLTNAPDGSEFPAIAVSRTNVHVVWSDRRNGYFNPEIYYKRSTDGGVSWEPDVRLTDALNDSYNSSITVSENDVHVVWDDSRSIPGQAFYKRSTDGGASWGADHQLTSTLQYPVLPSLAVSGSIVHVVWQGYHNGNTDISYRRSTNSGTSWEEADTILTNNPAWSEHPSIAVSAQGGVHVVWQDGRDGNSEIYYKRSMDAGISWGSDIRLTNNDSLSLYPSVSVSGTNIHVVWSDNRDGNWEVYYKYSSDRGLSWEADTRLTYAPSYSGKPSVAASRNHVHVVWNDNRDGNYEIYYKRNPTGNSGTETADERGQRLEGRFKPKPNPFTTFAMVPGQEKETFELYDIAGRKVGTYRGDRIGANLPAGVYFLRRMDVGTPPVRIVKVR